MGVGEPPQHTRGTQQSAVQTTAGEQQACSPRIWRAIRERREEQQRVARARLHGEAQVLEARRAAGRHVVQVQQQCGAPLEAVLGHQLRREAILSHAQRLCALQCTSAGVCEFMRIHVGHKQSAGAQDAMHLM